jgi:predicted nucleotidyltransferase
MGSPKGRLTILQTETLEALARRAPDFFLTGGAVLVGWTLKHRTTDDLDLFTASDDAMAGGDAAVRGAASEVRASVTPLTTTPDFHRYLLSRDGEAVRIDLVRDRTPALKPKTLVDGVRMDPPEEIFANKIAALVGRSEVRDLVDLFALERHGLRVEDHLEDAKKKDAGVSPATLAWLLSSIHVGDAGLEAFTRDLEQRMLALSPPQTK